MEDRRRRSRSLKSLPATEAELLWEIRGELAVLTERVDSHLELHKDQVKQLNKNKDSRFVKIGIIVAILSPVATHYLMLLGK